VLWVPMPDRIGAPPASMAACRAALLQADGLYIVTGPLWLPRQSEGGKWYMEHPLIGARQSSRINGWLWMRRAPGGLGACACMGS
jgi:hypothetical protein